jgi:hypothetical protein
MELKENKREASVKTRIERALEESDRYQYKSKTVAGYAMALRRLLWDNYLYNSLTVSNAYRDLATSLQTAKAVYGDSEPPTKD